MKIKINNPGAMGIVAIPAGDIIECDRVSNGFRPQGKKSYLVIDDKWIQAGHAEIVGDSAFEIDWSMAIGGLPHP